jgi:formylmethanofuran dehydrogenase subunit B
MAAWIDGKEVTPEAAAREAARVLAVARLPVFAGLGTDIAGARAVLALGRRLGAAVDHMNADALLRDLDVMREAGLMVTTPNEARLRADLLLFVGQGPAVHLDLSARLLDAPPGRRTVWICPPRKSALLDDHKSAIRAIGGGPAELPGLLALLRARVLGRAVTAASRTIKAIDVIAADLKAARFGVAVWSAEDLDALTIEMLCALVDDLNAGTRFTGLPLACADNARGVLAACGWTAGLPMRTGFGRGCPQHDPWRFDATRLVDSGEGDAALWISAYRAAGPSWKRDVPMVALTARDAAFRSPPRVLIEVGRPGIDHDAVEFRSESGTLMPIAAGRPSEQVPVARVIAEIDSALGAAGGPPC